MGKRGDMGKSRGEAIEGGSGADRIHGGARNDTLDGGAGTDRVSGDAGDDLLVFRPDGGGTDRYDGGAGTDSLRLELTSAEWGRADVQADIARYLASFESLRASDWFGFDSLGLEVRRIEELRVFVDGVQVAPGANAAPEARDDALVLTAPSLDGFTLNPDNGHYYRWETEHVLQPEALARAHDMGGYLATITSASENEFIRQLIAGADRDPWVGSSDLAAEGEWRWIDGPEAGELFWIGGPDGAAAGASFANWFPGEPNNFSGESFGTINVLGLWNDLGQPDRDTTGFVVEADAPVFVINAADLLANDADPDADALAVSGVAATSALGATLAFDGERIAYDPSALGGAPSSDSFTYSISDGRGGFDTASVQLSFSWAG